MKKILLIAALLTTSVGSAMDRSQCRALETLTKIVMELRNADVSASATKQFLYGKAPNNEELIDVIVDAAYDSGIPKGVDAEIISKLFYQRCIQ